MSLSWEIESLLMAKVDGSCNLTNQQKLKNNMIIHQKKPTSCHIDYSCKTIMPCGMLMSFAIT
jgi:hypothetical protein